MPADNIAMECNPESLPIADEEKFRFRDSAKVGLPSVGAVGVSVASQIIDKETH